MNKFIFTFLFLTAYSFSFAGVREFSNWTSSSNSAQAILYDALDAVQKLDAQSRFPQNVIVRKKNALVVKNESASFSCEGKTLGMMMVMSYRCLLAGNISNWSNDSDSVQAVLFETLATALEQDQNSPYPMNFIKRKNGSLVIDDGMTRVACKAGTNGLAQVQNYACYIN